MRAVPPVAVAVRYLTYLTLCHVATQLGHIAKECPLAMQQQPRAEGRNRFDVRCFNCGVLGHASNECKQAIVKVGLPDCLVLVLV